jgi:hypothetical protein
MMTAVNEPTVSGVEFRHIDCFPDHRVGDDGSVWSCKSGTWTQLKLGANYKGYSVVCLKVGARKKRFHVSRLVLQAFVGPCPPGMQACHFPDRTKTNNKLRNLRWGTAKDNARDRDIHGTTRRGIFGGGVIIGHKEVNEIVRLRASGRTLEELAVQFNLSKRSIRGIVGGQFCRSIKREPVVVWLVDISSAVIERVEYSASCRSKPRFLTKAAAVAFLNSYLTERVTEAKNAFDSAKSSLELYTRLLSKATGCQ